MLQCDVSIWLQLYTSLPDILDGVTQGIGSPFTIYIHESSHYYMDQLATVPYVVTSPTQYMNTN